MAIGKRDPNRQVVILMESSSGISFPVEIDDVTGRVIVNVRNTVATPNIPTNYHRLDPNDVPIIFAKPASGTVPVPILMDNNQNIWADVNVE
jgi:hypothetical protein